MQETPEGKVAEAWAAEQGKAGLDTADIAPTAAGLLAVKDQTEVTHQKRAAFLGARVMKDFVVTQIESELPASSVPEPQSPISLPFRP